MRNLDFDLKKHVKLNYSWISPRLWLSAQIRSVLIVCLRVGQQQLTYRFVLGNVNNQAMT